MSKKIGELLHFEKIKDVIDIDVLSDKKNMVEKYVITPTMEDQLVALLKNINDSTHKAAQIIGGYGSGKSHLLAFLISILADRELRGSIQNELVRRAADELSRDFAVIYWELQPNDNELSEYFYDKIGVQLEKHYGIKLELPETRVPDHKQNILTILDQVKADHPTRGLVVVVDEISDFLKQKSKEKINRDVQFLRVLGQAAQSCDFMFIGAMQEHVFSNPKYVDEAESIGRVSERFEVITIRREDIKRVISRRVLNKTTEQRLELERLFEQHLEYFPNLRTGLDEYISLFPLHPYVIQIFSELPYFEKRGIIQFTVDEVGKILEREFPHLITYDLIYDEIYSRHTIKNLEGVAPVVNAVDTLDSKIDLLEHRHQETARHLIKALAVLKLYGKSTSNGATVEELANSLLLLPENKMLEAADEIELVLNNLRQVTDGQFINRSSEGYYYLDLDLTIDYDQVIARRASNLPENAMDDEIISILKEQLGLGEAESGNSYPDSCRWPGRHSFREGRFIYETGKGETAAREGDYQFIFLSPFCEEQRYQALQDCLLFSGSFDAETLALLRQTAAARALVREDYNRSIMENRYAKLRPRFIEKMIGAYLETGLVRTDTMKRSVKSLISREFGNFDELFSEIKPRLLEELFNKRYPQHPRFTQQITRDNIEGEFNAALREILQKNGVQTLFAGARSVLNALELTDAEGNLSTIRSLASREIIKIARNNPGANVNVADLLQRFSGGPYGYAPLMTAFVIVMLTYNGEISLRAAGGKVISSSEVRDVFGTGLQAFENIRYLALESEISPEPLIKLFTALGIGPDQTGKLRATGKRGEAVQAFRTRYLELQEHLDYVRQKFENISLHHGEIIDVSALKERHEILDDLPLDELALVKTPADLRKIIYPGEKIQGISEACRVLQQLYDFYNRFFKEISAAVGYALEVKRILEEHPGIFQVEGLKGLLEESFASLSDTGRLLEPGQLNPLLGKLQQIRQKYSAAYYHAHKAYVGDATTWQRIADFTRDDPYRSLQMLKHVALLNRLPFSQVENDIAALNTLRCTDFRVGLLENRVTCPRCQFPLAFEGKSVDARISELEDRVAEIYAAWEANILVELNNYRDNLQYLGEDEASLIGQVLQQGRLEGLVSEQLIAALNNLFKELELVELDPENLLERLFSGGQVIDYYTLERRLNEYKQQLIAGRDLDKVRIKLIIPAKNLGL